MALAIGTSGPGGRSGRTAPLAPAINALAQRNAPKPEWDLYGASRFVPKPENDAVTRFIGGGLQAYNPMNIPQIPAGLQYAFQNPREALAQTFTTAEGLGGLTAAALPIVGGKVPRIPIKMAKKKSPLERVMDYPSGRNAYRGWRGSMWGPESLKRVLGKGGGAGGGGRFDDYHKVMEQRRVLDALEGSRGTSQIDVPGVDVQPSGLLNPSQLRGGGGASAASLGPDGGGFNWGGRSVLEPGADPTNMRANFNVRDNRGRPTLGDMGEQMTGPPETWGSQLNPAWMDYMDASKKSTPELWAHKGLMGPTEDTNFTVFGARGGEFGKKMLGKGRRLYGADDSRKILDDIMFQYMRGGATGGGPGGGGLNAAYRSLRNQNPWVWRQGD